MTTWWELGLTVLGWGAMCFGLFHLGRLWERDHPRQGPPMVLTYRYENPGRGVYDVRLGPYDQENEETEEERLFRYQAERVVWDNEILYGPHRRG